MVDANSKRTASAKPKVLDKEAQRRQDLDHGKIAAFVQNMEFGEVTLDDMDLDPELASHMHEWMGLRHPRTKASLMYDTIQFVLLLYIVAMVPWRIAFEMETTPYEFIFWWDIFIDLALCGDMILCMNRYYYDEISRKLITDTRLIRNAYFKSWFIVDFLSVVPFDFIIRAIMAHSDGSTEATARGTKMIRLARLARFAKMCVFMQKR